MSRLKGLTPENVFGFFEELCGIPHGSYYIDAISDHLAAFARKRDLKCVQDEQKNIVIYLDATPGYEKEPVLVLQGHMDMVAVSDDGRDMKKVPVEVTHDDAYVFARGTSLGGDDGIAVAMMMAIADDPSIPHPALDLLITTNEEVGMDGAVGLDPGLLRGSRFLNLDSEDEGIFTVGCAGGVRVVAKMRFTAEKTGASDIGKEIVVSGGLGGHSGQMIGLGRANANRILGRILLELSKETAVRLTTIGGGTAANAIPGEASMTVAADAADADALERILNRVSAEIRHEYHGKDDGLRILWKDAKTDPDGIGREDTKRLAAYLIAQPDGVQAMSGVVDGLVETSLNLGILRTERVEKEAVITAQYELRSMIGSAAMALKDRVTAIIRAFGFEAEVSSSYPEWEYREESPLREKMIRIWKEMYGKDPVVEVIHAGLECGVLAKKIEGFDAVSIGPDMQDIHTTKERLSIASTARIWDFVLRVLNDKNMI